MKSVEFLLQYPPRPPMAAMDRPRVREMVTDYERAYRLAAVQALGLSEARFAELLGGTVRVTSEQYGEFRALIAQADPKAKSRVRLIDGDAPSVVDLRPSDSPHFLDASRYHKGGFVREAVAHVNCRSRLVENVTQALASHDSVMRDPPWMSLPEATPTPVEVGGGYALVTRVMDEVSMQPLGEDVHVLSQNFPSLRLQSACDGVTQFKGVLTGDERRELAGAAVLYRDISGALRIGRVVDIYEGQAIRSRDAAHVRVKVEAGDGR